jgi:hypothetical protein
MKDWREAVTIKAIQERFPSKYELCSQAQEICIVVLYHSYRFAEDISCSEVVRIPTP